MSHGRFQSRHPRAPARRLSDRGDIPLRIGPLTLFSAAEWHERGIEQEQRGDLTAAIKSYRQALLVGGADVQVVFDLAYALAAAGHIGPAIERYRQVIELDATRQDAWANLGDLLLDDDQVNAGIEALRHAVRLDPDDPVARFDLADAYDAAGDDRAAEHWRAFLALASGPAEHVRYARCRAR